MMIRSLRLFLCTTAFCLSGFSCFSQYISEPGSADLLLSLKKLNTLGSVLYVAAHPDDENTRLLAYLAKEMNLRTGYISLTRGDGGQNLIGKEQGPMLGMLRTQELLAARRVDGAEQFFTRANDFGYSKNPDETFQFWNRDSILEDLVWVIRNFRPDIIICRFPATGEGGHGHHTASAILAEEAFTAAADPEKYPWQLNDVPVWKTRRIFFNAFNFGGNNTTTEDQIKLDVGGFNPILGRGYGEIASESRSNHKSQGFGSPRTRGKNLEYFRLLQGDSVLTSVFEKMDFSWSRLPGTEKIAAMIKSCQEQFDPNRPSALLPALLDLCRTLKQWQDRSPDAVYWKALKLRETESLVLACAGLWMEAAATDYSGIPGKEIRMNVQVLMRNLADVQVKSLNFFGKTDTLTSLKLSHNTLYTFTHLEPIPETTPFSSPYWLSGTHEPGRYVVADKRMTGKPENETTLQVFFNLDINGYSLKVVRPLVYKFTDPVKGEVYRPFEVLPPATVQLADRVLIADGKTPKTLKFIITSHTGQVKGNLKLAVPQGWTFSSGQTAFQLDQKGDEVVLSGELIPGGAVKEGKVKASLEINGKLYTKSIQRIEYDHVPYQFMLPEAEVKAISMDLKTGGKTVGYIPGAGDEVPACLEQAGFRVVILTEDLLRNEDLSRYFAIVTGIRAYNTNEHLQVHYSRLMHYIEQGGNLVVQYNTNNRIGPLLAKIGPYPFTISRERTTDEQAAVTLSDPSNPAFNKPNKMTEEDWKGWIQERGIYYAIETDSHYVTPLRMHDPGEQDVAGSLLIAPYGKGNFVYTGLTFFRQLPAGVPGAYRLFVNLLSLPKHE